MSQKTKRGRLSLGPRNEREFNAVAQANRLGLSLRIYPTRYTLAKWQDGLGWDGWVIIYRHKDLGEIERRLQKNA